VKVVVFGDSITKGVYVSEEENFTFLIQKETGFNVFNRGVPGNNTSQALLRFKEDVLDLKPDLVIIEFGMNDHFLIEENSHQVSPETFKSNLTEIIKRCKVQGAKTLIMTIHPILEGDDNHYYYSRHKKELYKDYRGANQLIKLYNKIIKQCALETESTLIDVERYFEYIIKKGELLENLLVSLKSSNLNDGVHPTALGHRLYAKAAIDALNEVGFVNK